jgi:hypothetical protein
MPGGGRAILTVARRSSSRVVFCSSAEVFPRGMAAGSLSLQAEEKAKTSRIPGSRVGRSMEGTSKPTLPYSHGDENCKKL